MKRAYDNSISDDRVSQHFGIGHSSLPPQLMRELQRTASTNYKFIYLFNRLSLDSVSWLHSPCPKPLTGLNWLRVNSNPWKTNCLSLDAHEKLGLVVGILLP